LKAKYVITIIVLCYLSISTMTMTITYANEQKHSKIITVHEYRKDVTGDGKEETIKLKGIPFEAGSHFLKAVYATVATSTGKTFKLMYEPGYDPKLTFLDVNHDGVKDIFESSATGGSGGMMNYRINSIKGEEQSEIPLPPPLKLQGKFDQAFTASLKIMDTNQTFLINLRSRQKDYVRLGLYQKNGILNEPTELMIDPVAVYKPVKISGKKGYGLLGLQQVSGAYHADRIGTILSTWYYEHGRWQLIKTKWQVGNRS